MWGDVIFFFEMGPSYSKYIYYPLLYFWIPLTFPWFYGTSMPTWKEKKYKVINVFFYLFLPYSPNINACSASSRYKSQIKFSYGKIKAEYRLIHFLLNKTRYAYNLNFNFFLRCLLKIWWGFFIIFLFLFFFFRSASSNNFFLNSW
jgi:hypothetical protein